MAGFDPGSPTTSAGSEHMLMPSESTTDAGLGIPGVLRRSLPHPPPTAGARSTTSWNLPIWGPAETNIGTSPRDETTALLAKTSCTTPGCWSWTAASGLDPARIDLKELLRELTRWARPTFISSHILPELPTSAAASGSRAGRLVACGRVDEIITMDRGRSMRSGCGTRRRPEPWSPRPPVAAASGSGQCALFQFRLLEELAELGI